MHPQSRVQKVKSTRGSHHRFTGAARHSPRNGFNGFLRALPGDRAYLPPSPAGDSRKLDASVGASEPHDFAVREAGAFVFRATSRPPHPVPNVRDDRETPLSGTGWRGYNFDLGQTRTELFLQMGVDRANQIESIQQMTLRAHPKALQISGSMRSLSSDWRDNRCPSGGSADTVRGGSSMAAPSTR